MYREREGGREREREREKERDEERERGRERLGIHKLLQHAECYRSDIRPLSRMIFARISASAASSEQKTEERSPG